MSIYLDDLMIATEAVDENLEILRIVFERLVKNKLELRLDKCKFMKSNIGYLGYTISCEGIRPDERIIDSVTNFPIPRNVREVQSFLGLCSYFRHFVKDFSTMARPLYNFVRGNSCRQFGEDERKCFELLKSKLVEAPILSIFDPSDETELHCDASSHGFGAILLQRKNDGKFYPIFYFSKRTSDSVSKYHSFELETLAIIYAIHRFRIFARI